MADLLWTSANMVDEIERGMGWASAAEAQSALALNWLNYGYWRFLTGLWTDPENPRAVYQHSWSFLKPWASMNLVVGQTEYDLPAGFLQLVTDPVYAYYTASNTNFAAGHVGSFVTATQTLTRTAPTLGYTAFPVLNAGDKIHITGGTGVTVGWYTIASRTSASIIVLTTDIGGTNPTNVTWDTVGLDPADGITLPKLNRATPEQIMAFLRDDAVTDNPEYYAVYPKTLTEATGQRYSIRFYPAPSTVRAISYRFDLQPTQLTDAAVYPLGGFLHQGAILEAGLARMELEAGGGLNSPHEVAYQRLVQNSVAADQQTEATDIPTSMADYDTGIDA